MTNHDVWDAVQQTDGDVGNSFEFLLDAKQLSGAWVTAIADVTNVNPAFTGKNRARNTYAAKGTDRAQKYGDSLVFSWDHEIVRDENGQYQPELQDLIDASKSKGVAATRELRGYDALGADYAFEGSFTISISRTNADWDAAGFYTITATQYGEVNWIDNPVLTGNIPADLEVSPASAAGGATVVIQGRNFYKDGAADVIGAAAVKFGSTNATSFVVQSDTIITAVVPGTGDSQLIVHVTNSAGESTAPFHRTA